MKVQLLDLGSQYRKIKKEVLAEIRKVCDSQHYVLGKNVKSFEQEVADYCGSKYAVGVASGSDALLLSLMAAGVGPGDKVITTPFTFFATVGSIAILGAEPVFVDIDPRTYNMDPASLEKRLKARSTKDVKAVIPVHLFGQCADMGPIKRVSKKYGLKIVEDAAQAIGAEYKGKKAGSLGDTGCFSFYPTKNLGGFGDGGMITTNNKSTAEKLRMLRGHGSRKRYYHEILGTNSRLDEIQAAALRVKLRYLDEWQSLRIRNAGRYDELFKKAGLDEKVTLPYVQKENLSVYNQYVVRVPKRDALRERLKEKGIGTEVYYPVPVHLQKCFRHLGLGKGDFPVSEKAAREVMALPIYPELTLKQQKYVVSAIEAFYAG